MAEEERMNRIREKFNQMDKDGSGFLTREEIKEAVCKICEELGISQDLAIEEANVSRFEIRPSEK